MDNSQAPDEEQAISDALELAGGIRNVELQDVRRPSVAGLGDTHQRSLRESTMQELMPLSPDRSSRIFPASSHQSLLRQQAHTHPRYVEHYDHNVSDLANPVSTHQSTYQSYTSSHTTRNTYYSTAAARASENIMRAYHENRQHPELAPPCSGNPSAVHMQIRENSGWSLMETSSSMTGGTPPCERSLHTAAVLNGCLYMFGGYDGQTRVNDFHCFSFAEKRFSPVLPASNSGQPPSPRDRHVAVVYGNSFYVFGGFDGTSRVSDFSFLFLFTIPLLH